MFVIHSLEGSTIALAIRSVDDPDLSIQTEPIREWGRFDVKRGAGSGIGRDLYGNSIALIIHSLDPCSVALLLFTCLIPYHELFDN